MYFLISHLWPKQNTHVVKNLPLLPLLLFGVGGGRRYYHVLVLDHSISISITSASVAIGLLAMEPVVVED